MSIVDFDYYTGYWCYYGLRIPELIDKERIRWDNKLLNLIYEK